MDGKTPLLAAHGDRHSAIRIADRDVITPNKLQVLRAEPIYIWFPKHTRYRWVLKIISLWIIDPVSSLADARGRMCRVGVEPRWPAAKNLRTVKSPIETICGNNTER